MRLINGVPHPSVTEVIAAAGIGPDYSAVPRALLDHAAERGTALHLALQYAAEGDLDETTLHPEIVPGFTAHKKFLAESKYRAIATELELVHPTMGFLGHPDSVGYLDGKVVLPDIKYVATVDLDYAALQLAGYRLLWDALHPAEAISKTFILHLRKDGDYRLPEVKTVGVPTQTFLGALLCWRERHRRNLL